VLDVLATGVALVPTGGPIDGTVLYWDPPRRWWVTKPGPGLLQLAGSWGIEAATRRVGEPAAIRISSAATGLSLAQVL
jgi:hypothetical protein